MNMTARQRITPSSERDLKRKKMLVMPRDDKATLRRKEDTTPIYQMRFFLAPNSPPTIILSFPFLSPLFLYTFPLIRDEERGGEKGPRAKTLAGGGHNSISYKRKEERGKGKAKGSIGGAVSEAKRQAERERGCTVL